MLKGISAHFKEPEPASPSWHKDLLQQMATTTDDRPAVLTAALREELDALRAFRHFSRNATALDPDWLRMLPLLASLDDMAERFLAEVSRFIAGA